MSLSARAVALAANTPCPRLDYLAATGHSDTKTATAYGYNTKQPRLAYAAGISFENRVTKDPEKLAALLTSDPGNIVEITDTHGTDQAHQKTLEALQDPTSSIILQGAVPGVFGGYNRPDIIYKRNNTWIAAEIKIYLDKDTETDPYAFGQATAQAAITAAYLKTTGLPTSTYVTVILSTLSGAPTTYTINAKSEIHRMHALRARARQTQATPTPEPPTTLPADHIYTLACHGKCALAQYCKDQLTAGGAIFPSTPTPALANTTEKQLMDYIRANPHTTGYDLAQPIT